MTGFLLLHSPLVGPGTWEPVASLLGSRGHVVSTPDLRLASARAPYYAALQGIIAAALAAHPVEVIVAHSGAGALVSSALEGRRGVILVDALLPHPGMSWMQTAPPALVERLTGMAEGGVLGAWNTWFPPDAIERLLPDRAVRSAFLDELTPLPLAYFEESAPDWPGLDWKRTAYLQLSDAYASEAAFVEQAGGRVRRRASHHLAMLTQADKVAGDLIALARDLAVPETR